MTGAVDPAIMALPWAVSGSELITLEGAADLDGGGDLSGARDRVAAQDGTLAAGGNGLIRVSLPCGL